MQVAPPAHRIAGGEYAIDAFALRDASSTGYIARVIVKQLPGMRELFREDVTSCGQLWADPKDAQAAALARGQALVRSHLCGQTWAVQAPQAADE